MKATFDIPDELYRRVKARSAMEGRPVRAVAVELFQGWLGAAKSSSEAELLNNSHTAEEIKNYPWLKIAKPHIEVGMSHDLDEMDEAIARGWGEESTEKFHRIEEGF